MEHTCKNCTTGMDGRPIDVLSYQPFSWSHRECAKRVAERQALQEAEKSEPEQPPQTAEAAITEHSPGTSFAPSDFPCVVVESKPYVSAVVMRPDPMISVSETEVLTVEVGTVRLVFPTRTDWDKFVLMGNRLHSAQHHINEETARVSDTDR